MVIRAETKVLIAGGGTAGWMTAALLSRLLGPAVKIRLIESDAIGTVGVGEATIPAIQHFNAVLGIPEAEFLNATQGTIKLGIQFEHWGKQGDSYMHAFGPVGRQLGVTSFHHYWLAAQARGDTSGFWDYSLNYQAAKTGKYAPLPQVPNTPLQGLVHAYHFDASLYAALLRRYSEQLGVQRTEGTIASVNKTTSGDIASVTLQDGSSYKADLFIDCSGLRALLIGQELSVGYEDWRHWLPCDTALAVPSEVILPIMPYTRSIAHTGGWQWRIPLQHRTGNGLVYSSQFLTDDAAHNTLLDNLDAPALAEPRKINFVTGRRKQQWVRNCIAIGLSSGFLEPLESTSIHLIQSAVLRLVQCFPGADNIDTVRQEYNRQSQTEYEAIRDFIILHYHLNQRDDNGLWQYCRQMVLPDSLKQRIELFKQSALVFRQQDELFTEVAWQQVMLGQGLIPTAYHPMADNLTDKQLSSFLIDLKHIITHTTQQLPPHQAFLQQ
ncbi:tryptophan halogenase family protein [Rheinheimera aquimaris]|jgi:tryptophan halogenase|uniref:tryptophan halogenase family protein n=1 Tax=Rheinheimera aquimaris TaxID=412437 RepID=UPI000E89083E|nr:tryptophan halogenase family protein [Rheinheimera aquimaris]HBN89087.1 tryptophan halogenase [Rheinheimera sp.]